MGAEVKVGWQVNPFRRFPRAEGMTRGELLLATAFAVHLVASISAARDWHAVSAAAHLVAAGFCLAYAWEVGTRGR